MLTAYPHNGGYNELVISADSFEAALPSVIEAFFFLRTGACDASAHCRGWAERAQRAFSIEFGGDASSVPLLTLDGSNWEAPFAPAET